MPNNKPLEFFIQWHLTEQCNLRCRHCYQGERAGNEMRLPEINEVISEASDMIRQWSMTCGVEFSACMNITGGEPFLRPDLFEILYEVKKHGFKVYLLTNGTLVDRGRAQKLARSGVDGVQVSLDGAQDIHDVLRGQGSFSASAAGIRNLIDAGLEVTLNMTMSQVNAGEIKKVIAFGLETGVRRIGFSRLVPTGRGRALLSQMLGKDELYAVYRSFFRRNLQALK